MKPLNKEPEFSTTHFYFLYKLADLIDKNDELKHFVHCKMVERDHED